MPSGRGHRLSVAVLALGLLVAAAIAPAEPAGASERILAHWTLTLTGTIRHTWSLPDPRPCGPTGNGYVSVRFKTTHPERITIGDNGYGPGDITWNDEFNNIAGTLTAVDARTENPPPPDQSSCYDTAPVPDTRSCGTYHFHSGLSVDEPLGRRGNRAYRLTDFGNFTNAAHSGSRRVEDCETGGFVSFAWIGDSVEPAAEQLKLPGYPTAAQLASRHGRIVIAVAQSHHWFAHTLTVRHVRLVFTRVG
jgi:hypothetical protein